MSDLFERLETATRENAPLPSVKLAALLSGKVTWADAEPSIRSWATFHIFDAARKIIRMDGPEKRRMALGKIPGTIRPFVETEIKRLWPMRASL